MRRILPRLALLTLAGISLCQVCCGDNTPQRGAIPPPTGASLEGTITYGGQKVPVALVIAQTADASGTGFVDDDGRYRIKNAPLGEVNIAINVAAGRGAMMGRMMSGKGKGPAPKVVDVPIKYADPTKSGIKTTINKGENTFDIVIPN
jgi:hypothetical protein